MSLSGGATLPALDQDWPAAVWSFLLWARVRLQRLDTGEIYYGEEWIMVMIIKSLFGPSYLRFPK